MLVQKHRVTLSFLEGIAMCIGLIGGMDRLERHYTEEAQKFKVELKVFNKYETNLFKKIQHVDALIIFTNKVSHGARKEAVHVARNRNIPLFMVHSCGIGTLRRCLNSLCFKGI